MRLIDANALDARLVSEYLMYNDVNTMLTLKGVQVYNAAIDAARSKTGESPTIDAVPVVHARWSKPFIGGYNGLHAVYYRTCSNCSSDEIDLYYNYCPNCGAKMDAKEDGESE